MDGSQLVAEAVRPRGTSEGQMGHDWVTDQYQFNAQTGVPNGCQTRGRPENRYGRTTVVKLTNIIMIWLALLAGILAFDFMILWIASGRVIERIPF